MKKQALASIIAAACAGSALASTSAPQWIRIAEADPYIAYANPAYISLSKGFGEMAVLSNFHEPQKKWVRSTMAFWRADCGSGQLRLLKVISFSEHFAKGTDNLGEPESADSKKPYSRPKP